MIFYMSLLHVLRQILSPAGSLTVGFSKESKTYMRAKLLLKEKKTIKLRARAKK